MIREILKLLGLLKLTRPSNQVIDARLQGIMFLLEVFQNHGKVRKKNVMTRSSVEVEYRTMALGTCEEKS